MRGSGLLLFVCAGLMLSGGTILGGTTAWTLLNVSYYFWTTDLGVELCSGILIIAGALLCLPTCWLATIVPYHPKRSSLLGAMLVLMIATMLTLSLGVSSIAGLSHELRDVSKLNSSMMRAMLHSNFDPAVRSSFAAMQVELKCCGVNSYRDWYQYRAVSLPASCCGKVWNKQNEQCLVATYTTGCLRPALMELRRYANSLCILASAIIIILAVSLFGGVHTLVNAEELQDRPPKPAAPLRVACLPHTFIQNTPSLVPPVNTQPI